MTVPPNIALIGKGAIGRFVFDALDRLGLAPSVLILREGSAAPADLRRIPAVFSAREVHSDVSLTLDCAGHAALREHGPALLERGIDVATLSIGALADPKVEQALTQAARRGQSQLHLASGAIGALDSLRAAAIGGLDQVTYIGRKPPLGWKGSPAEDVLNLKTLREPAEHFSGSAREAALAYPKNANVAAAVALAGVGFDQTQVRLIADPAASGNLHEIKADGAFGRLSFAIEGLSLPDNPRSSALAAMSMVATVQRSRKSISL